MAAYQNSKGTIVREIGAFLLVILSLSSLATSQNVVGEKQRKQVLEQDEKMKIARLITTLVGPVGLRVTNTSWHAVLNPEGWREVR